MHCAGGFLILRRDRLVLSLLTKLPFRRVGESGFGWKAVLTSSARLGQGARMRPSHPPKVLAAFTTHHNNALRERLLAHLLSY